MAAQNTRMLSAEELVQFRIKVDKTLPIRGTKEFRPSNSWLEKKQIQAALDERKSLLGEERVERLGALTRAEWDPELKIANVTHRVGRHWKQMGHEVGGKLHLFPEEALFLLETTGLELMHNGVPMSIQEGYSILLGADTGCTFNEYQTYVHLVRQGYIVLRHSKSIRATRYERQIRLDQYSVGQKQSKMKENTSVQEIITEDGSIDTKASVGVIKPSHRTEDVQNDVKAVDQEIIDVETIENVDIDESFKISWSIEKSVSRSSSKSDNIKSNPVESKMTVRTEPGRKEISTVNEVESGEEAIKIVKDKTSVQKKDSQTQSSLGSDSSCKRDYISVDDKNFRSDLQVMATVPDSRSGINKEDVEGNGVSSAKSRRQSNGVSNESSNRDIISGITAESCGITAVGVETMTASSLEKSDSAVCCQDGESSKETNSANEISSYTEGKNKYDNYTSESVKAVEPTSSKIIDVTIVDEDSSTLVDVSQKEICSEHRNETELQHTRHEGGKKQSTDEQNVTQKPEKGITDYSDIVDISDSSQTSHPDLKIESSATIRRCGNQNKTLTENNDEAEIREIESSAPIRCGNQNKTLTENNDEVEIVSVVDVKDDADNEIVEVNHSASVRYVSRFRQRKSYQNSVKTSAVKNEIQVLQKNTTATKPYVVDVQSDVLANVTPSSSTQNSKLGLGSRQLSNDMACFGRGKVTNIHLKHDEVEITPSIIDISEETGKQGPSYIKQDEAACTRRSEIEVVDLEDEDIRPGLSWEDERMRILDSIPSIDGKFIIHVRVPDKNLLPQNVCPQKDDYYIHKFYLTAPGIGGKPTAGLPNNRAHRWQDSQPLQTAGQINPWIQEPTYNFGGGGNMFGAAGVWNNSAFPLSGLFMNQQYQSPFPGAYELQTIFHQPAPMLSVLGNPAWEHNRMYGMPALAPVPQHSRIPRGQRPLWHYQTRPYYRRPDYKRRKRRCEMQYHSTPVALGQRHFESQPVSNNDIIPLRVEDEIHDQAVEVAPKDEKVDGDDDNDGVIECMSVSPPVKAGNEPMECTSGEGEKFYSNKNGIDRRRKRKQSRNTRFYEPPKKMRSFIEKLRLETIEEKRRKDILKDEVQGKECKQEVLQQEDTAAADVKSWKDLKSVMQVVVLDSSSEDEDDVYVVDVDDIQGPEMETNGPLVQPEDCKNIDSVLKKLQIIKCVDFEEEKKGETDGRLKISFDLYLPTATFRKASPGLPNYRITVLGCGDPTPEPKETVSLLKDFQDDVPVLFALVLPNTVTFLQFGSVKLPVETFCLSL